MASVLDTLDRPHLGTLPPRRQAPLARILNNITVDEAGCWIWNGQLNNSGYGLICVAQSGYKPLSLTVHKASYELRHGRVPGGMVLDHLCRVRACVNPDHLEVVTQRENVMRSAITLGHQNGSKTHCLRGHEFNEENTRFLVLGPPRTSHVRQCRPCERQRYADKRAALTSGSDTQ